jgi:GT2 family glycosyltransferase
LKVSVVIPTSNGSRFLGPCLEALQASRLPPGVQLEPIVVDNGSTDATPEVLARHSEVKVLAFPRPMGFAQANNAARGVATGEVVCFLNNDTRVDPGWLERPVQIFTRDERVVGVGSKLLYMNLFLRVRFLLPQRTRLRVAAAVFGNALADKVRSSPDARDGWVRNGSALYVPVPVPGIDSSFTADPVVRLLDASGTLDGAAVDAGGGTLHRIVRLPAIVRVDSSAPAVRLIQNAGNFLNDRLEGGDVGSGEEEGDGRFTSEDVVPAICGAAMFARRGRLDAVGWFPDYYTMYYEAVDLCLRLRSAGGILVFCPSSVVHHYHTGTSGEFSPKFIENVARSSLLFTSRYGTAAVFARTLVERLGHTRNELVHGAWSAAAGTRGLLSALPALRQPVMSRLRASVSGAKAPSELVRSPRLPYTESR